MVAVMGCIALFLILPITASLRSYIVMYPYSQINKKDSVLHKEDIDFNIPGGTFTSRKNWYPFVNTFTDDEGLSDYIGEAVQFTVLYNFGHFTSKGYSTYYDPKSPYYSSFYGGYIVKPEEKGRRFGFHDNGEINKDELAKVPKYDQTHLVLPTLGCYGNRKVFQNDILSIEKGIDYAGYKGWVKVDSEIKTNSPLHRPTGFKQGYLQFGRPRASLIPVTEEDFNVVTLKGRVYARYFEEFDATIMLFIMAPDWETVEQCDGEILSHTEIGKIKN